ncbi:MAG: acyl-CoA thioesterase, partial [Planctomycetales bacterium]|nr:acyl-CoA thioesterase [Planctomycetales bacterium]
MGERFRTQRRVEFCETDAAGIAHFSAFFTYMEQAEHALLRELGTSVVRHEGEAVVSWPRVSASC